MTKAKTKIAGDVVVPAKGQFVRVKAHRDGYRRAGIAHAKAGVDHAHDKFDAEQLKQLQADPNLTVSIVDAPDAKADGAGAANGDALSASVTKLVDEIIAANSDKAEEVKSDTRKASWFVGQVMKASDEKPEPKAVKALVLSRLGVSEG